MPQIYNGFVLSEKSVGHKNSLGVPTDFAD